MLEGGPGGHEQRVGNEDARRLAMRAEHPYGFAGLHEQRLIVLEREERRHDRVERGPVARGPPRAAVDDEVLRALGHIRVEVVHQHPQRGLLWPTLARAGRAAWCADDA